MAVAAGEAQATVNQRIPIGGGRAIYLGMFAFGTEYPTGGATIATAEGSRYLLPSKLDHIHMAPTGGFAGELIKPGKLKVLQPGEASKPLSELANKTNLSAITAAQFMAIGLA